MQGDKVKSALYKSLKESEVLFHLITDYAVNGYIFWAKSNNKSCLIDSKLAAKINKSGATLINLGTFNNLFDNYIERIITHVTEKHNSSINTTEITEFKINEEGYKEELFVSSHIDASSKQEYVLVAIRQSKYIEDNRIFSEFSNAVDIATWQCNIQTGELLVNDKWATVLGYTHEELRPISFDTFVKLTHPADLDYVNNLLEQYSKGEIEEYKCEVRMLHKNQHWKWVKSEGKAVSRSDDGRVEWMIGSHIDITDRKIQEQEASLLTLIPIKTFYATIITEANGKITHVNDAFTKMTGYESDEVIGKKPGNILQGPLTSERDIISFKRNLVAEQPFTQQILNYTKTGTPYYASISVSPVFDEEGALTNFIAIQRDVTEEKKNKEFLDTFKNTLDQTKDCIFLFDEENLEFFYVNEGALAMMEYDQEELQKMHPYDIKPEYPKDKFKQFVSKLKHSEEKTTRFITIHRTKSGKDIPVEVFLQYIKDESQKPHFVAIVHDITERLTEKKRLKRLSLVAEKTTNLVVIMDKSGCVEFVNKAFEIKTGYTLEELRGKRISSFMVGPETNMEVIEARIKGLRGNKSFSQEILKYTKAGEPFWVSITYNPIFDDNGKLTNFIAIETDITEAKIQERRIAESEERLRFVLDGAELGYWDWKASTGKLTVNDRWYQMMGYQPRDFEATIDQWHSLVHPDDLKKLEQIMENNFKPLGESEFSVEIRAKHKQGHYVWILDSGDVTERDKEGTPIRISGTHLKITERKSLEKELQKERTFLQNIIDAKALSVVIINNQGEITFANSGAESVLGLEKSKIESKKFNDPDWKVIGLDGKPFPEELLPFAQVMRTHEPVKDVQHGMVWQSGRIRYVSVSGTPFTYQHGEIYDIIFSVTDITDRVIAQRQLNSTKIQMESILKEISDVVYSINIPSYNISFITPSIEKISGFPSAYYLDKPVQSSWNDRIYKPDKYLIEKAYNDLNETGGFEVEYRILTKNGGFKWVLDKGYFIYEDGSASRLDGFITDITERKAQEKSIKDYVKIVEGQNERLKNFTYIVSHNLRSHSSNIQGLVSLISQNDNDCKDDELFGLLGQASNKLEDTLHHLNNTVSVVSAKQEMKSVNLLKFINDFEQGFTQMLKDGGVSFINEISKDLYVQVVPAFLDSIIINLITNAVKYSDQKKESFVRVSAREFNSIVVIFVEDNGLGINLELYGDKLFGMFKTFHKNKDAKGIGLFMTKNQIEAMGGRIKVESKPGEGSVFTVFLKNGKI